MSNNVDPALEGAAYVLDGHEHTVGPKCNSNEGFWVCITHKTSFRNQMEKDSHIHRGDHVLTWSCWEHGPEVP
jgi:hypothetical protein